MLKCMALRETKGSQELFVFGMRRGYTQGKFIHESRLAVRWKLDHISRLHDLRVNRKRVFLWWIWDNAFD